MVVTGLPQLLNVGTGAIDARFAIVGLLMTIVGLVLVIRVRREMRVRR